jgi:nicotinamidase/pyrazinamidase
MTDAVAPAQEAITPIDLAGLTFQDGDVLLIVDPSRDLFPGGTMPVTEADAIVPIINRWIVTFRDARAPIVASLDWHPPQTVHFMDFGGEWPPHCLAGTEGAFPHPDLFLLPPDDPVIGDLTAAGEFTYVFKGFNPNDDGHSAFDGKTFIDGMGEVTLLEYLALIGAARLFVCGLATEYCVRNTVLDALSAGTACFVILDAIASVDASEDGAGEIAIEEMRRTGAGLLIQEDREDDPDFGKYVQCVPSGVDVTPGVVSTEEGVDAEGVDEAVQEEILAEGVDVDTGDVVDQDEAEGSTDDSDDDAIPEEAASPPKGRASRRRKKVEAGSTL